MLALGFAWIGSDDMALGLDSDNISAIVLSVDALILDESRRISTASTALHYNTATHIRMTPIVLPARRFEPREVHA